MFLSLTFQVLVRLRLCLILLLRMCASGRPMSIGSLLWWETNHDLNECMITFVPFEQFERPKRIQSTKVLKKSSHCSLKTHRSKVRRLCAANSTNRAMWRGGIQTIEDMFCER